MFFGVWWGLPFGRFCLSDGATQRVCSTRFLGDGWTEADHVPCRLPKTLGLVPTGKRPENGYPEKNERFMVDHRPEQAFC